MKSTNLAFRRGYECGEKERVKFNHSLIFPCPFSQSVKMIGKYSAWVSGWYLGRKSK